MTDAATADPTAVGSAPAGRRRQLPSAPVLAAAVVLLAVASVVHLTQGTSTVGAGDVVRLLFDWDQATWDVLLGSRLPRLVAALVVGAALGGSGAALQSVARNHLASPELLGVSAGAYFAVTAVAAFGVTLPLWAAGSVAFLGGLLAAALVMALAAGGAAGSTRLVLAGSAASLSLASGTSLLLILFQEETRGLFAWGSGSLLAVDMQASGRMAPVLVLGVLGLVALGGRLDMLVLGDDAATALGVRVRAVRVGATLLAVLLAAAAVTVAGPIGFVGLSAPVIARLVASRAPSLLRHAALIPFAAVVGSLVVVASDVGLRALVGAAQGVEVPTGAVTTLTGSLLLVVLARQHRDAGVARDAPAARWRSVRSRRRAVVVVGVLVALLGAAVLAGALLGGSTLLTGDIAAWLTGSAGTRTSFILDERLPRVGAAVFAGAALALAGTGVQAVSRNPLAEPGILGITAGAGLGAVVLTTSVDGAGIWWMAAAATVAAALTFVAVYAAAWRGGLSPDRLVLVGIGISAALGALTVVVLVTTDPWNTPKVLTWLSGSTYGRQFDHLLPVLASLVIAAPLLLAAHRRLDLLAIDDDVPRILGLPLERTRLVVLVLAVLLTATSVTAVGVVGFVGLVAPHAARALVGGGHRRVLVVACLLGAVLLSVADTVGRTVIAPAQVPAGLITALVGTPYFVWLLWRSRPA
ncbi:iron ABC transporter permease [Actinomarinicola tropica]|uniref:Fe(3+)-hydroxamate ABC transporter permease FhuB n=1 Tax=Actinomarinicola tropica TaxID=2789776 RepID=A0A5Q2RGT3_9ACTN|nr:iron ABC transporter permease [Actinomarinicola tropica]QGG96028.1 Fe(3+)-hydroxamate ABC transporter permease FhuB [Actinomarinicola tropica]